MVLNLRESPVNTMVSWGCLLYRKGWFLSVESVHYLWSKDAFLEDRSGGLQDTLDPWIQLLGNWRSWWR